MTRLYVWHAAFICATGLVRMCDVTYSCVCYDAFICVACLIHTPHMRIYTCGMTPSYAWHDSFGCVTWLIWTCDMTHLDVRHDWFERVTWLIRTCDMTHSRLYVMRMIVSHDSWLIQGEWYDWGLIQLERVTWLIHDFMWCVWSCGVTHDSFKTNDMTHDSFKMSDMTHSRLYVMHMIMWHDS